MKSTETYLNQIETVKELLCKAECVLIGAGAGMSVSAGFVYTGKRFAENFADFIETYGFTDMYSAGFYPFKTLEEYWGYWSRYIFANRYTEAEKDTYRKLYQLVRDRDYFVITTNVDHQFQKAGFDKGRLFYTQGDFGLFQCSGPCHDTVCDNEEAIIRMVKEQKNRKIPSKLVPYCPNCGRPMAVNLRSDSTFVEDEGWRRAAERYSDFLKHMGHKRTLLLELGVGMNTPGIIKYKFWELLGENPNASYVCVNNGEVFAPLELADRSVLLKTDIGELLEAVMEDPQPSGASSMHFAGLK